MCDFIPCTLWCCCSLHCAPWCKLWAVYEAPIAKTELKADPLTRSITSCERQKISGQIEETPEISLENDGELEFGPTSLHIGGIHLQTQSHVCMWQNDATSYSWYWSSKKSKERKKVAPIQEFEVTIEARHWWELTVKRAAHKDVKIWDKCALLWRKCVLWQFLWWRCWLAPVFAKCPTKGCSLTQS